MEFNIYILFRDIYANGIKMIFNETTIEQNFSALYILIIFVLMIFSMYESYKNEIDKIHIEFVTPGIIDVSKKIRGLNNNNLLSISLFNTKQDKQVMYSESNSQNGVKEKNINDLIMILDPQGRVLFANDYTLENFGIKKSDFLGESFMDVLSKLDIYSKSWFDQVLMEHESKLVIRTNIEHEKWYLLKFNANLDTNYDIDSITVTGNDVSMLIDLDSFRDLYSDKDYLTGLINQYGMFERIKHMNNISTGIACFIQILHFTELTNYYGHEISNSLLNEIVRELKSIIPYDCILARYTESKFVLLQTNPHNLDELIENLNKFLKTSYQIDNLNLQVEKRIGYSNYPENTNDLETLLTQSSIALKQAIIANSSKSVPFKEYMMDQLKYNIEIANKLKLALDEERIEVFFQKAIDCRTNEIFVVEELSRWKDEDLGYISPVDFFRVARDTNQLQRLDRYMVKKSIEAFLKLRMKEEYGQVKLTLNISPETLLDEDFYEYINKIVESHNINQDDIYIEISESTFINNLDLCISSINHFKDNGYKIALDDFGTEYSSLSILESVNFDIIKIDQHFIKNINKIGNQEIIKMIRKLTRLTYREMVAEGVETKEQSDLLTKLGCQIQQGYYLHRPENLLLFSK